MLVYAHDLAIPLHVKTYGDIRQTAILIFPILGLRKSTLKGIFALLECKKKNFF